MYVAGTLLAEITPYIIIISDNTAHGQIAHYGAGLTVGGGIIIYGKFSATESTLGGQVPSVFVGELFNFPQKNDLSVINFPPPPAPLAR
ncbi:hypothetical protein J6590_068621 [Homalodisca vitripennis]|nr:hypothetical protein J6590_068621 [Homalodisca vitripennis]